MAWKRMSLRTSLILVTLACLLLGWHMHHVGVQCAAVACLEAAGVEVEYAPPRYGVAPDWAVQWLGRDHFASPAGAVLYAKNVDFTDRERLEDLAGQLRRLSGLRCLDIVDRNYVIEEGDLQILLTGLNQIERLNLAELHYSFITREALQPLTQLDKLTDVELSWVPNNLTPDGSALDTLTEMQRLQTLTLPWYANEEASQIKQKRPDMNVKLEPYPRIGGVLIRMHNPNANANWKSSLDSTPTD